MTVMTTIYLITALSALFFILSYMPRHWWEHPTGHSIMATKIAIFLMSLGVVAELNDLGGGRALLAASGVLMTLVLLLRLVLLYTVSKPDPPVEVLTEEDAPVTSFHFPNKTSEED